MNFIRLLSLIGVFRSLSCCTSITEAPCAPPFTHAASVYCQWPITPEEIQGSHINLGSKTNTEDMKFAAYSEGESSSMAQSSHVLVQTYSPYGEVCNLVPIIKVTNNQLPEKMNTHTGDSISGIKSIVWDNKFQSPSCLHWLLTMKSGCLFCCIIKGPDWVDLTPRLICPVHARQLPGWSVSITNWQAWYFLHIWILHQRASFKAREKQN